MYLKTAEKYREEPPSHPNPPANTPPLPAAPASALGAGHSNSRVAIEQMWDESLVSPQRN
jgi:hypothetical protein